MGNALKLFTGTDGGFDPCSQQKTEPIDVLDRLVEQYAVQVLDFASQYGSDSSYSYTAANCLGMTINQFQTESKFKITREFCEYVVIQFEFKFPLQFDISKFTK